MWPASALGLEGDLEYEGDYGDTFDRVDGHRVSDFPHQKYTRDRLSKVTFAPTSGLWILEAMICHPTLKMGAFFEDLLS